MIPRRHKVLVIVLFAFVMTMSFKPFPKDKPTKHIPFSDVPMGTKTWVFLGSDHVSHALLLFALIVAIADDKELRKLLWVFIGLELMSLVDYMLTYNADFWLPEFDSNVVKLVTYSVMIGWIITTDVKKSLYAKRT